MLRSSLLAAKPLRPTLKICRRQIFFTLRWSRSRYKCRASDPPQAGRRFCAAQAFWAAAQNLGAGAIDSPRACGIIGAPTGLISRGVCGITFEKFQDIKEGDVIEAYLMEQIEV